MYCGNYQAYYTKGLHRFESIKQGCCNIHNKIVANNDTCECWETCKRRFYARKSAISRTLYEIFMDISAIRQIMQEEQDEGKNL